MRSDRPATGSLVIVEDAGRVIYDMDVQLRTGELPALPGCVVEPWLRIELGAEATMSAGVTITQGPSKQRMT